MTYPHLSYCEDTELKSQAHVQGSLNRRAPTIQKLAKTYNDLCRSISHMISRGQAPAGAVAPEPIPDGGLWKLDVDDAIWQDVGLDDEPAGDPPNWLADEDTRAGIRSVLEYDRCCEEEARLIRERLSMQDWMEEEWAVIVAARHASSKFEDPFHCISTDRTCLQMTET